MASCAGPVGKRLRKEPVMPAGFMSAGSADRGLPGTVDELHAVMAMPGAFSLDKMDCLAITHAPEAADLMEAWNMKDDDKWCDVIEEGIIGKWWRINDSLNGPPCWKKEPEGPYMFYEPSQHGWVISTSLVEISDETMWAWGPVPHDHDPCPEKLHVPFWSKKSNQMVLLEFINNFDIRI